MPKRSRLDALLPRGIPYGRTPEQQHRVAKITSLYFFALAGLFASLPFWLGHGHTSTAQFAVTLLCAVASAAYGSGSSAETGGPTLGDLFRSPTGRARQ